MLRRLRALIALGSALVALAACDAGTLTETPQDCTDAGMQCRLPEGPLGVCERATCATGTKPPCFQCVPQH